MTDWNQYARDVQAASNAAHNKDQKRIKELESKLAKAVEELAEAEGKLALMIFERDEVMMFERDEAWKRAAHSEKMWGEAEVKLAKAVEALRNTLDKPRDADQSYVELWADTIKEVRAVLTELEGETK